VFKPAGAVLSCGIRVVPLETQNLSERPAGAEAHRRIVIYIYSNHAEEDIGWENASRSLLGSEPF
jgi:hypothetical protein